MGSQRVGHNCRSSPVTVINNDYHLWPAYYVPGISVTVPSFSDQPFLRPRKSPFYRCESPFYICWITEKAREFKKNIYFCFTDYTKTFDCVDHNKLWKILKELGILEHLTCLQRNLYAGQEATVRPKHGKTDWFQIGKGVHQGCILSPFV